MHMFDCGACHMHSTPVMTEARLNSSDCALVETRHSCRRRSAGVCASTEACALHGNNHRTGVSQLIHKYDAGCALLCSVGGRKHTSACAPHFKCKLVQCASGAQTTSCNQNTTEVSLPAGLFPNSVQLYKTQT